MTHRSSHLPSKCCCCSLRTGTIVVGSFTLVVALTFLGLSATASSVLGRCEHYGTTSQCHPPSETSKRVAYMMILLAVVNAVEVVMSVCLIWGASKIILGMMRGWLIVSATWLLLHGAAVIAYAFASTYIIWPIIVLVIGIFILGMALLCMFTVLSFLQEISNSLHRKKTPTPSNSLPHSSMPTEVPTVSRYVAESLPPYYPNFPTIEIA